MIYFIVLFILFVCIYVFDYRKSRHGSMVPYVIMCIAFILIAGLRYRIGGDSIGYELNYADFPTLGELSSFKFSSTRYEPGFVVIASIPRTFSDDFTYFQLLHAAIVNSIVFWFIAKNTKNKFIGITLYGVGLYLNLNTEVLREALAVSCFLLAWPFFKDGKWYFYYPIMLLATAFHISAAITFLLPIFALPGFRQAFILGWRTLFIGLFVFIVFYYLQRKFFAYILMIDSEGAMGDRAYMYSKSTYGGMNFNIFGFLEHALKTMVIPAVALYYRRLIVRKSDDPGEKKRFEKLEVIVVTGIYFAVVTTTIFIAARFNNYVSAFNYVLIASCFFTTIRLRKAKLRISPPMWFMILVIVLALDFKGYYTPTYKSATNKRYMLYYPYSSRFDPQNDPNREEILRVAAHIK